MIYLKLFLTFLEIGTVSFGGGYGMIALVREAVLGNGWLTEEEFLNLIAVSESTPGPIAVNTATFVGSTQGGFFGALAATLGVDAFIVQDIGVVLPSFVIILVIAALIRNFLQYAGVQAFLSGVRPCVVAMILATAVTMGLKSLVQFQRWGDRFTPDWKSLAIFVLLWAVHLFWKKTRKKAPSPMAMIGLSALMGILFFGLA